jgi:hypothetical protein
MLAKLAPYLPYLWGALGGLGVLVAYFGLKRVADAKRPERERKAALWLVNLGVLLVAASLAGTLWLS